MIKIVMIIDLFASGRIYWHKLLYYSTINVTQGEEDAFF